MTMHTEPLSLWQHLRQHPFGPSALLFFLLLFAATFTPPAFAVFSLSYLVLMLGVVALSAALNTPRWWVAWLIGTLCWA
jgi:hypothetical protein